MKILRFRVGNGASLPGRSPRAEATAREDAGYISFVRFAMEGGRSLGSQAFLFLFVIY